MKVSNKPKSFPKLHLPKPFNKCYKYIYCRMHNKQIACSQALEQCDGSAVSCTKAMLKLVDYNDDHRQQLINNIDPQDVIKMQRKAAVGKPKQLKHIKEIFVRYVQAFMKQYKIKMSSLSRKAQHCFGHVYIDTLKLSDNQKDSLHTQLRYEGAGWFYYMIKAHQSVKEQKQVSEA